MIGNCIILLVYIQTETSTEEDADEQDELKPIAISPQLEIIIISEVMTSLWASLKQRQEFDDQALMISTLASLLNQLLATVVQQHQTYSPSEEHWAEADVRQILKDSMDDIDILRQSLESNTGASFSINDVIKHMEFICNQFDERCLVMEQDMNYCVEKFHDVVSFSASK